ncbi:unnamed protein product [Caenorhabditis bovis]|uniref:Serine/threonine specific protein phosphatases domain-containing protein n=1 Tax=Caenorhabditis bovis TaxID=2654633 RepID=A0A8S1ETA4_9PELO|nr:unnamed protein product [Caenorhabditis bovis]
MTSESVGLSNEATVQFVDVSEGINPDNVSYEQLGKNLWIYMMSYYPNGPKPKWEPKILSSLLDDSMKAMQNDPMVPNMATPAVVFGPIYGEADSLITLISMAGRPPDVNYVFLGCYLGHGFAPLESLAFLLCYKVLYPNRVILLKGHHEESIAIQLLKVNELLVQRGVAKLDAEKLVEQMKRTCSFMPPAALINTRILCVPGGPGPLMRKFGLKYLCDMNRLPKTINDKKIVMEASWSVLILNEAQKDMNGMPSFTMEQAAQFCVDNDIECLIRGRQLVDEGFLNKPREVITLVSAVAYLDNFRNYAACMKIEGRNATIIRYKMEEGEQLSLELVKPGMGRNAVW